MHLTLPNKSLSLLVLLHTRYIAAIINSPQSANGNKLSHSYLNKERPLWVLQDQVPHHDYSDIIYTKSHNPFIYEQEEKQKPRMHEHQLSTNGPRRKKWLPQSQSPQLHSYRHPSPFFKLPQRIRLPSHYLPAQRRHNQPQFQHQQKRPRYFSNPSSAATNALTTHFKPSYIPHLVMPTFDSLPGDDNAQPSPIFIYNGPKGELILNTMFSARKYPMQEPVPGQILYPPSVPLFRPRPIVERFRVPGTEQTLNLTLIPFYAHEAIDISKATRMLDQDNSVSTAFATPPTVLYASAGHTTIAPATSQRRHEKQAKHYAAYRSPSEVHWQPTSPVVTTTPFPLAVANPLQNHRYAELDVTTPTNYDTYKYSDNSAETQRVEVVNKLDLNTSDSAPSDNEDEAPLRIVYMDESLEKPSTATKPPLLSSRYTLLKEYYAFPVFTLGKLLKPETQAKRLPAKMLESMTDKESDQMQTTERSRATDADEEHDEVDTWFILNSRYKGHHNDNGDFRLSSKYIQNTAHETTDLDITNGIFK